jgi:PAS domain S-box-containing protein
MRQLIHTAFVEAFHTLRLKGPLASDVNARILHWTALGLFGLFCVHLLLVSVFSPRPLAAAAIVTSLLSGILLCLFLLRRGRMRAACLIYLIGVFGATTLAIILNGGIRSIGLAYYVALPISATWLLGVRSSLWMAGACLGGSLVMAVLEMAGVRFPGYFSGVPITSWLSLVEAVVMTTVPVGVVLRTMRDALTKSRAAEEALRKELAAHQRTEEALRESEARFRNVADTAPIMIWACDPERKLTFMNERLRAFLGGNFEDWRKEEDWGQAVHPDDFSNTRAAFGSGVDHRCGFQTEFRIRRSDGQYRTLLSTGVPRFVNGMYEGHIGVFSDLTDLRRDQEHVLNAQKLESLGVMSAGVAHDFNNLLGAILASAEGALAELPQSSTATADLDRIRVVSLRAAEIVRQLMAYAGASDTERIETLDVNQIINELSPLFRLSVARTAQLELRLDDMPSPVCASPAQIRQVLLNLVGNASDALQDRAGLITIGTGRVRVEQTAEFRGVPAGEYVSLVVSDSGCGITPEVQARMFDPFYSTKGPGRGLGLASIRGIVSRSGGVIHVTSEVGRGTRFELLLPYSAHSTSSAAIQTALPVAAMKDTLSGRTILMVEDEETLRVAVSKALKKRGLTVLTADSGPSAVDIFREHAVVVDVVLLDMTLPGLSGREVLEHMRAFKPDANLVLTSAYGWDCLSTGDRGTALPALRFIRKPYQLSDLMQTLHESLCSSEPRAYSTTQR